MGQVPVILQISGLLDIGFNPCDPQHGMVVSETPLTLFQVGLEKIGGIAEPAVPLLIGVDKPADDVPFSP